jgi:hypothetical protein
MKPLMSTRAVPPPKSVPAAPPPALRPTRLDYVLILLGLAVSLCLLEMSSHQDHPQQPPADNVPRASSALLRLPENAPDYVPPYVLRVLPTLLFLPLGVLLFWPVFYITQRILGRPQALTLGEWLWGVAWLATVALVAWIVCHYYLEMPSNLNLDEVRRWVFLGYTVTTLALAAIALLLNVIDLIDRRRKPWTHAFGLVLLSWPALPLLALLAWK